MSLYFFVSHEKVEKFAFVSKQIGILVRGWGSCDSPSPLPTLRLLHCFQQALQRLHSKAEGRPVL